jgi:hypothetical protein
LRFLKYRDVAGGEYDPDVHGYAEEWLDTMERNFESDGLLKGVEWPSRLQHSLIADRLLGRASEWYRYALKGVPSQERTYEMLKTQLISSFGLHPMRTSDIIKADMTTRPKRASETWKEYASVLHKMTAGIQVSEEWMVACFIKGIDSAAAKDLHLSRVQTMLAGVQMLEVLYGAGNVSTSKTTRAFAGALVEGEEEESPKPTREDQLMESLDVVCRLISNPSKRARDSGSGNEAVPASKRYRTDNQTCWNCGVMGHVASECTKTKVPGAIEKGVQEFRKRRLMKTAVYGSAKNE